MENEMLSAQSLSTLASDIATADEIAPRLQTFIRDGLAREGFARKTLVHRTLKKGEIGKISVRKKDVDMSGGAAVQVRQHYITPAEFTLTGSAEIEDADFEQDPDILIDTIIQAIESTLVKEDQTWKKLADAAAQVVPDAPLPQLLASMQATLKNQGIPAGMWLFGSGVFAKLVSDSSWLDPATKRQLIKTGKMPHILGASIHSDYGRDESLRVLGPDDVYLVGKPQFVGAILERKPLAITGSSGAAIGRPIVSVFWEAIESMTVANGRGIVKGKAK